MANQPEARIVVERAKNGKREILQVDPKSGRVMRTGLKVADNAQAIHETVQKIADSHKRSGNRVSYKEMG